MHEDQVEVPKTIPSSRQNNNNTKDTAFRRNSRDWHYPQDLNDVELIISTVRSFGSQVLAPQEANEYSRQWTIHIYQEVVPRAATALHFSLFQNTITWCQVHGAALDLALFLISIRKENWKEFASGRTGKVDNYYTLCCKIFWRDLGHLDIPESTVLVHYIDDSILIWPGVHEVVTTLDIQEINITKIQRSASPTEEVQGFSGLPGHSLQK